MDSAGQWEGRGGPTGGEVAEKESCGRGDLELPDALGGEGRRMGGAAGGQVRWPASCRGE
jgi:hypothetical protein